MVLNYLLVLVMMLSNCLTPMYGRRVASRGDAGESRISNSPPPAHDSPQVANILESERLNSVTQWTYGPCIASLSLISSTTGALNA